MRAGLLDGAHDVTVNASLQQAFARKSLVNMKEPVNQFEKDNDFNATNDGSRRSHYSADHEQEPIGSPAA